MFSTDNAENILNFLNHGLDYQARCERFIDKDKKLRKRDLLGCITKF